MYPGDPTADPANVYNCRCTIAARVISIGGVKVNDKLAKADRETAQDWWEENHGKDLTLKENRGKIKTKSISQQDKAPPVGNNTANGITGSDGFSKEAKEKLLRTEQINNGNRYETAYVYNTDGTLKFKKKGDGNSVFLSKAELKKSKNCVITHNHPNNSCFSADDIEILRYSKASELRASTKFGTYSIKPPKVWSKEIDDLEKIDKVYNSYIDDVILKYKDVAAQEGKPLLFYYQLAEEEGTRSFCEKYGFSFRLERYI